MHCCSLNSVSVNEVLQYVCWMLYYKHNHLNAYKTSADGFACQCGTDVSFWWCTFSQCDLFCSYGYRCSAHPLILSVILLPWGRKRKSHVVATLNNAEPVMESSYRIELLFHSTLGCFFTLLCCSEILLSGSASFCLNHINHESQLKRLKYHQITMKNENKGVWK